MVLCLLSQSENMANLAFPSVAYKRQTSVSLPMHSHEVKPAVLSWHNLEVFANIRPQSCHIPCHKGDKTLLPILKGVNGDSHPKQMLAILGASGSGKTTLLNTLSGRNGVNTVVHGVVKVNGKELGKNVSSISAYVQQDDLFIGTLTVHEHLVFQSLLRMERRLSYEQRLSRVNQIITELGLTHCAHTLIGNPTLARGISGGERKRLAIGSEMLTNPSLIFCDEPTSGLDSYMAQNVISLLRKMAANGCNVICTIHQPSSDIYTMFDHVLYLADGRVAYQGSRTDAVSFFAKQGLPCPLNFNPADFIIGQLALMPGHEVECQKKVAEICQAFASQGREIEEASNLPSFGGEDLFGTLQSRNKASWCMQCRALLWRSVLSMLREPYITTVRIFQTVVLALLLGSIYWKQELNNVESIMNLNGVLFMILAALSFQNFFYVSNVFTLELPVFLREYSNSMYRAYIYFMCKTLAELPIFILIPIILISMTYWMIGLYNDTETFLLCLFTLVLVSNAACSFGYLVSCISSDITMALTLGAPLMIPLMLFGGFFLNNNSVPPYYVWIKYMSWFYYSFEIITVNQWEKIDCIGEKPACLSKGSDVLKTFSFTKDHLYLDLSMLAILVVVYRLLAFFLLLNKTRSSR